ncbi:putative transcription factor Nin-like family [Helianthus anomalus]
MSIFATFASNILNLTFDLLHCMYAVSRSTLKRICRSHGIPRWPYSRTPNETDPLPKPDQTDAAVHASDRALTTLPRFRHF